jgi:hypothetical protein
LVLLVTVAGGCGYQPAYGGTRPEGRLSVLAAPSRAPEGGALAALLSGLRDELSKAGVLGPGTGYPRVVVELVRVDERGAGPSQLGNTAWAVARGSIVGVTARAWIEESPSQVTRDSGDVRRTVTFGTQSGALDALLTREAALTEAGRATGAALGRRVLGEVEVTQEPM